MGCGCGPRKHDLTYTITCLCGTTRILPYGIKPGEKVELVPCPKCSLPLRGIFTGDTLEEIFDNG